MDLDGLKNMNVGVMMNKTAILIDSTLYMSEAELKEYGFYVVPLTVNFDHISYTEDSTDSTQIVEVFGKIDNSKKLPQTSQPSTNDALEVFEKIKSQGYNRIISIHISSKLSGTFQGMKIAAEQYMEENSGITIEIYDTKLTGQFGAVTAKTVAKYLEKHGDITSEKVQEIVDFNAENTGVYLLVDKLDYLAYGGRIPATLASVGNLFGLAPIITVNEEGSLERYKAERSQKKAIMSILKELEDKHFNVNDDIILSSIYTTEGKMAKKLLKEAVKITDANIIESTSTPMGIVVSNHLGPNAFGLFWTREYKI